MDKIKIEEHLINEVQVRPALFNKALREYKDEGRKLELWNEIAEQLENAYTGLLCKKLWESLRSQYGAYTRKLKLPTGSGLGKTPYYKHAESMKFLDDFVEPRKTTSNFEYPTDVDESSLTSPASADSLEFILHDADDESLTEIRNIPVNILTTPHTQKSASYGKRKRVGNNLTSFETSLTNTLESLNKTSEDEHDLFLKSLGPALKRLHGKNPVEAAKFKMNVQRMLFEAEFAE